MVCQSISVKEDNMVASTSHHQRSSNGKHDSDKLAPGAKVTLHGLVRSPQKYKNNSWPDQSRLNGSIGFIMRVERDYWIVELEADNTVGFL